MKFTYLKQPLRKYTFEAPKIKQWVEERCYGKTLNLFSGNTKLNCNEVRVDCDKTMMADFYMDALKFAGETKEKFDVIILDPPYSYRKSMEKYNGNIASPFRQLKDSIQKILKEKGRIITFGYHSTCMGNKRGFQLTEVCLICHGGAQHDTIAIVEERR